MTTLKAYGPPNRSTTGHSAADAGRVKDARSAENRMGERIEEPPAIFPLLAESKTRGADSSTPRNPSAAGAQEFDIAGGGPHLEGGAAAVQLAFRCKALRARPVAAFAGYANIGEVRLDCVSVGKIDAGANRHGHIRRNVDDDIACRGF